MTRRWLLSDARIDDGGNLVIGEITELTHEEAFGSAPVLPCTEKATIRVTAVDLDSKTITIG